MTDTSETPTKAVLITGCSTGIGRATAEHLAERGWNVYATARRTESIEDLREKGCKTLATRRHRRGVDARCGPGGGSVPRARSACS